MTAALTQGEAMQTTTNYAITIDLTNGHSVAVVHGASDKYEALRVVRANGYKPVVSAAVREVSDEVAAMIPYPMWK
jgi:hypothetical protein